MKISEMRSKSLADLRKELLELRRAQFNMRMQLGLGQFSRNDQFQKTRKDIARIKTVMNEMKSGNAS